MSRAAVLAGKISAGLVTTNDLPSAEPANPHLIKANADKQLAAGYTVASVSDGAKSSGTYKPSPAGGNYRRITNAGAFTLQAPDAADDYSMIIHVENVSGAGVITKSGFAKADGDEFTTTVGDKFRCFITKLNGVVDLHVRALQ